MNDNRHLHEHQPQCIYMHEYDESPRCRELSYRVSHSNCARMEILRGRIAPQHGVTALTLAGKEYKVHAFLEDAARIVPDLIAAINRISAVKVKAKLPQRQRSNVFDSTMSYDDAHE